MSHFECHLSRRYWRSKKVVQVVQIRGREVIWTKIQKNSSFFRQTFPDANSKNVLEGTMATINMVLNLAPVHNLFTIWTSELTHVQMGFLHMSFAVGSFHKLFAAVSTSKSIFCSSYKTINT